MEQHPTIVINTTPEYLRISQICEYFGVGKSAVYEAINNPLNGIKVVKVPGASKTVNVESFRKYVEKWRLK